MKLFENQTSNGQSLVFTAQSDVSVITCQGTWGSAVIYLQIKPKESLVWSDTGDTLTSDNPSGILDKIVQNEFRLDLRNSDGSTNINAFVTRGDYGFQ